MISHHDYRLSHLSQAGVYFTPLDEQTELNMEKNFQHFSQHQPSANSVIELFGRHIPVRKEAADTVKSSLNF